MGDKMIFVCAECNIDFIKPERLLVHYESRMKAPHDISKLYPSMGEKLKKDSVVLKRLLKIQKKDELDETTNKV